MSYNAIYFILIGIIFLSIFLALYYWAKNEEYLVTWSGESSV